jgi:hypothetical protein
MERLKRPGYWILLLIALVYGIYISDSSPKTEIGKEIDTGLERVSSYADRIFEDLRRRDSYAVQNYFSPSERKKIALEDVALFIDTIDMEENTSAHWSEYNVSGENIELTGTAEGGKKRYRVQMMLIRRGDKVMLRALRVGDKSLSGKNRGFPFDYIGEWGEKNESERNETGVDRYERK